MSGNLNVAELNTLDYRCPEVMIQVRRFLRNNVDNSVCKVITTEPSTMRDIPFYCNDQDLQLLSRKDNEDGSYEYVISRPDNVVEVSNSILNGESWQTANTINVETEKKSRDRELFEAFRKMVEDFKLLINDGFQLIIPSSFGKDSSSVLTGAIAAHLELMREPDSMVNEETPFIVIHIDTGVEVSPMAMYSDYAMTELRAFCKLNKINLVLHHKTPPLHEQFVSLFVGARKLPSTPALKNSDCSVIWKVQASEAIQRSLVKEYGIDKLVSCFGSRNDEGVKRAASLAKYGNDKTTAESLITGGESGLKTYAPIVDWSNEDVFDLLQRAGSDPLLQPDSMYRIPAFMNSYRVLIKIYGDSAADTCMVNIGQHKANSAGCAGSARNGCHQCFKTGRTDKAAMAQNEYLRWSTIQANATKVRDWVFSLAHDITARTLHPRTFDPVTNHVVLQPNILRSGILEKMLTYYVQLTDDDRIRSERFKNLLAKGRAMEDEGYAEIANDNTMDEKTRNEYLKMYSRGAQKNLIRIATLEHCIFLSAQWAMDGVKSLPFRPIAIWDNVVNKGIRIPYPKTDKSQKLIVDEIHDAITFRLCEPGIDLLEQWTCPPRSWDINEADRTEGCSTETIPNTLRVRVCYSKGESDQEDLKVTLNGKKMKLGVNTHTAIMSEARQKHSEQGKPKTLKFTMFLTQRKMASLGTRITDRARKPVKHINFTKRTTKKIRQTGKFVRTRTSLQMYRASETASLTTSNISDVPIWIPDQTKIQVPFISQHQKELPVDEDNFQISIEALYDWLAYDGFEKAMNIYHFHLNRLRRIRNRIGRKFTLRSFCGSVAFWELMQSGVISVNHNSWYTCQSTLKRTELFHSAGLLEFSDDYDEVIQQPKCVSMADHRRLKAKILWHEIRPKRNADRKQTISRIAAMKTDLESMVYDDLIARIDTLNNYRLNIAGATFINERLIVASGTSGFDHLDYVSSSRLAEDWLSEYGNCLLSIDAFVESFGTSREKAEVSTNLLLKIKLNKYLSKLNTSYIQGLEKQIACWQKLNAQLVMLRNTTSSRAIAEKDSREVVSSIIDSYQAVIPQFSWVGRFVGDILTGNYQSFSCRVLKKDTVLSLDWHEAHWTRFANVLGSTASLIANLKSDIDAQADSLFGRTKPTGIAKLKALQKLSLMSCAA